MYSRGGGCATFVHARLQREQALQHMQTLVADPVHPFLEKVATVYPSAPWPLIIRITVNRHLHSFASKLTHTMYITSYLVLADTQFALLQQPLVL